MAKQYARAKECQLEALAEDIVDIADSVEPISDATGKARLQIDSRKWLLSKLVPKKYGDKVTTEHTGAEGGPIQARVTVEFVGAAPGGVPLPVASQS